MQAKSVGPQDDWVRDFSRQSFCNLLAMPFELGKNIPVNIQHILALTVLQ